MADQLKIVYGSSEIDLLSGDGYALRLDGWTPQIAQRNFDGAYEDVIETITLKANGSSTLNLMNAISEDFEDKAEWINERINDPVSPDLDLVYLSWQFDGQLVERQALIKNFSYQMNSSPFFPPVTNQKTFPNLTLVINRRPFWEDPSARYATAWTVNASGTNKVLTTSVSSRGTVNGRVRRVFVQGGTNLSEYWMGFRTDKYGDKDDFNPVWPFDFVTVDNDATSETSNSADGSVSTVSWSSGDTSLLERMRINLSQVSAIPESTYRSQRGTFTVLLRARSTGTETFNARLSDGFYTDGTDPKNTHSRVRISGTSFKFYNMGTVTIPPMALRATSYDLSMLDNYHLRLFVEVASSGTGNFEATRFVLIPEEQGFLHIKGINTASINSSYIEIGPEGRVSAFTLLGTTTAVQRPTQLDISNFRFPRTDCNVVMAGHGTSQSLTGTVNIAIYYHPSWLGLGGV